MAKFIMVGDVHLSDRPPTTRVEGYAEDILHKLQEISDLAESHDVDGVVYVGDIFHSKIPRNTSYRLVSSLGDIWRHQRPTYVVPGNHDYAAQNIETLRSHPLYQLSCLPNVSLFGTPSQRRIEIGGVTFQGVREEEGIRAFDGGADVVVAHSPIFPPNRGPKVWEHIDAYKLIQGLTEPPGVIWYGHIHEPAGHFRVGDTDFVNLGAISRGSLHEESADRIPEVGLLEMPFGFRALPLQSARPASEVFRYQEVEKARAEAVSATEFAESLSSVKLSKFTVEGVIHELREGSFGDIPKPIVQRAIELVQHASEK